MLGTAGRDDGWTGVGAVIVSGFGFGSLFALLVTMGQLGVQPQLLGLVTAQTAAVRALGIAGESLTFRNDLDVRRLT